MKLKTLLLLFASCLLFHAGSAQSIQPTVIASDGGFFSSGSGNISWTLGEPMSETYTSTNNNLTQGFHQPFGLIVSGIPGSFTFGPSVYPNPTAGLVFINMGKMPAGEYDIQLFDALGKKVSATIGVGGDPTPFSVQTEKFANGIYLLRISSANFDQSFRIVKTK